jgi:hypothetical protein
VLPAFSPSITDFVLPAFSPRYPPPVIVYRLLSIRHRASDSKQRTMNKPIHPIRADWPFRSIQKAFISVNFRSKRAHFCEFLLISAHFCLTHFNIYTFARAKTPFFSQNPLSLQKHQGKSPPKNPISRQIKTLSVLNLYED